jgi:trehalose-phosphatase
MSSLWSAWPRLKPILEAKRRKVLFLDFDGTLAPIERTPDRACCPEPTLRLLGELSRRADCWLVIISGRSLGDLRRRLRLRRAWFVGNHGLEMSGRGLRTPERARQARQLKALLFVIVEKLRSDVGFLPGVIVEDKGFTVSVHYRNLPPECLPALTQAFHYFRRRYRGQPLLWRRGKMVYEVVPDVRWDKGEAAAYVASHWPGALPIAIGDDRTDEDMFRALKRRGVTVRVGYDKKSAADYYLKSQKDVHVLLERL